LAIDPNQAFDQPGSITLNIPNFDSRPAYSNKSGQRHAVNALASFKGGREKTKVEQLMIAGLVIFMKKTAMMHNNSTSLFDD